MHFAFKRNRIHFTTALFFFSLFLGITGYKISFLKYPILSKPVENLWTWELKIHVQGKESKHLISHFLPRTEIGQNIIREDFVSPKFYFFIGRKNGNLSIDWRSKGLASETRLFYRVTVQTKPRKFTLDLHQADEETYSPHLSRYLVITDEPESVSMEMEKFLDELVVRKQNKTERVKTIFDFISKEVKTVSFVKDKSLISAIKKRKATSAQKRKLFIQLARMAKIPARSVHGVFLEEKIRQKKLYSWAEVFLQGKWIPVDIEKQLFGQLPENVLILYRGNWPFIASPTAESFEYSYSALKETQQTFSHFYETATLIGSTLHEWSLFSLPIENQQVFRVILMIPLGALVVTVFRNIIGINT
ncbi:MAG TPA: UUP1 family membrane protein, partial [Thermodesulfobacteriota bacterium]|nr:UUP1 family membrane protein [Thermodesulfobacteriota bacterium]